MKIYSAINACDDENVLSLHASREGAIAAVRAWIDLQGHPEWDDWWKQPPDDWQGERWWRHSGSMDYVKVDECELLP